MDGTDPGSPLSPLPREIVHYSVLYLNFVHFLQALDLEFNYLRQLNV